MVLLDSISVYIGPSAREGEERGRRKKEIIDEGKYTNNLLTTPIVSTVGHIFWPDTKICYYSLCSVSLTFKLATWFFNAIYSLFIMLICAI